ncbi:MAG: hypothetical protein WCR78_03435 [Arcobacteraceae bacterium]
MFKNLILVILLSMLFNGCTGKQLKETGGGISNNALGLVVGLPMYGIGVLVEKNEKAQSEKLAKEETKQEQLNVEEPFDEAKITEEVK